MYFSICVCVSYHRSRISQNKSDTSQMLWLSWQLNKVSILRKITTAFYLALPHSSPVWFYLTQVNIASGNNISVFDLTNYICDAVYKGHAFHLQGREAREPSTSCVYQAIFNLTIGV